MNRMLSRPVRATASLLLGAALVLASILPAFAYNEENVLHVRVRVVGEIHCGTPPMTVEATLTDRDDNAVIGAQVNFSMQISQPGDVLTPPQDFSDAQGKAETTLTMAPRRGVRQIVASVPGGAAGRLTISAAAHPGCFGPPGGGGIVLPATTVLPPTGGVLPATSTAEEVALVVARNLPIGAALAVSIGMLALLYVMRRARGSRPTGTR